MMTRKTLLVLPFAATLALAACSDDDPTDTPLDTGSDAGTDVTDASGDVMDDAMDDGGGDTMDDAMVDTGGDVEPVECEPQPSDYSPGADDEWPECISDDGTYHQIQESISTLGRVAGFEDIAELLWRDGTPSADDFISARDIYSTGEGLDSRISRREDEHYPPVTDPGTGDTLRCRDEGVPEMDPQRCVGPALIQPILQDAFQEGAVGNDPEINAARVEAALLWFLYVSSHKESISCAVAAKDCDSSYAYYTGGAPRDEGLGLAGYVVDLDPDVHDAVWNGILASRCWRDLDDAEEAQDLEMRDRATAQLDRALLRGVALVVLDRLATWQAATGVDKEAAAAFLEILGPVLHREATERNPELADDIAASEWENLDDNAQSLRSAVETIFPCW